MIDKFVSSIVVHNYQVYQICQMYQIYISQVYQVYISNVSNGGVATRTLATFYIFVYRLGLGLAIFAKKKKKT